MKAEIKKDKFIWITAETVEEALALKYVSEGIHTVSPFVIETSILQEKEDV